MVANIDDLTTPPPFPYHSLFPFVIREYDDDDIPQLCMSSVDIVHSYQQKELAMPGC